MVSLTNDILDEWDRKHFFHPSTPIGSHLRGESPSLFIERADGCYIEDREGNRYLDGFGGLYCVNVGYDRREVIDAIKDQADKLCFYHTFAGHCNESSAKLSKMIIDRAPDNMSHVYFGFGGSDANDTNIKLLWYYHTVMGHNNKKKIISRDRAYHGSSLVSGSLTGLGGFHKNFGIPFDWVLRTRSAYYYRREKEYESLSEREYSELCGLELRSLIEEEGADNIAAFIAEPMMGTGGIVPPPVGYWENILPVLKEHNIIIISDEVVTGFGRLGSMFGCQHYGIEPEIMSIAKGLTSAYVPLSGSIISSRVMEVLKDGNDAQSGPFGHAWTYAAHPLACAAGIANLQVIDRYNLIANAKQMGSLLVSSMKEALSEIDIVGEVRGEGLLCAVELVSDKKNREFFEKPMSVSSKVISSMLSRGVMARAMPASDILGFSPPFSIDEDQVAEIVSVTRDAVCEVAASL